MIELDMLTLAALVLCAYLGGVLDARKRIELDLLKGKSVILGKSVVTVKK